MTLEECYTQMAADYQDVLRRMGKDSRIQRFLLMFLEDKSFPDLCRALETGDGPEAFRCAHSLKGISMNLALTALCASTAALTEDLRNGQVSDRSRHLFGRVEADYRLAVASIQQLCQT